MIQAYVIFHHCLKKKFILSVVVGLINTTNCHIVDIRKTLLQSLIVDNFVHGSLKHRDTISLKDAYANNYQPYNDLIWVA